MYLRTILFVVLVLALVGCKDDPPTAQQSDQLLLHSYAESARVSVNSTLMLEWTADLASEEDSIVIEAVSHQTPMASRVLIVLPGRSGSFSIAAREIGYSTFHFTLHTRRSGIVRQTAPISLSNQDRDIWFEKPAKPAVLRAIDTLLVQWSSLGLASDEVVTLSIRSSDSDPWQKLREVLPAESVLKLPVADLSRSSFVLKLATESGDASAISPKVFVLSDTANPPILIVSPNPGDTLQYPRDGITWARNPFSTANIREFEVHAEHNGQPSGQRRFPVTGTTISLKEMLFGEPGSGPYTFYIRALPDTHTVIFGPLYIYNFQIVTNLQPVGLRRGTAPKVIVRHTGFKEWINHNSKGPRTDYITFAISTDEGQTWVEDNSIVQENQELLLHAPGGDRCYLRMRATRGSRVFEDVVGPFRIVDETAPLFHGMLVIPIAIHLKAADQLPGGIR